MKGIILAGGSGSRLHPITLGVSKQLLPVYDKPMIYYPLSVLMLAGIRDILIITTLEDQSNFKKILGNGEDFGIKLSYRCQESPEGIAQAFLIGEDFIAGDPVALILGDNIFYGADLSQKLIDAVDKSQVIGATIFGYWVNDEVAKSLGIVELSESGHVISIEEKPSKPKSNYAVTGLYFYDSDVVDIAKEISPSVRGELEITSINQIYLERNSLNVEQLGRGYAWLDTGTHDSLVAAGQFIQTIEKRQGLKVGCLEEIAFENDWLSKSDILRKAEKLSNTSYGKYLNRFVK
ncbi:MAG: glucose-1-phosphate thymidylyltransferase RfbA [Lentisphaeraceae bacterium]|nr:glucose-1-phosphate thymidylyltransferase RfbA [Lentisphaeraceae bacterium]